jgi:rare lipoprotein A (peptidoglycan hydrolase)
MYRRRLTGALAVFMAGSSLAWAGVAAGQSGGIGTGETDGTTTSTNNADTSYQKVPFGKRDLRRGNRGDDVKTLTWLLRAQSLGVPTGPDFVGETESAVREFQDSIGVSKTGVVQKSTRKGFAKRMRVNNATWYGPGFWGNRTACGKTLKPTTVGVAHKKLPCGTKVTFAYKGHWVRAKVIDRGPYNGDYKWDLTRKLAKRLGFLNVGAGSLRAGVVR